MELIYFIVIPALIQLLINNSIILKVSGYLVLSILNVLFHVCSKSDPDLIQKFKKESIGFSPFYKNDEPHGLVFGKYFIGLIITTEENKSPVTKLYLIYFKYSKSPIPVIPESKSLKYRKATSSPYEDDKDDTVEREFNLKPTDYQDFICRLIKSIYDKHGNCSVALYGDPGCGKSTIAELVAKTLNSDFVVSPINLVVNGLGFLSSISNQVLVIDEFVNMLANYKPIGTKHQIPILDSDIKSSWNKFFDVLMSRFNHITLLTSNIYKNGKMVKVNDMNLDDITLDFVNSISSNVLDESGLRPGRIDCKIIIQASSLNRINENSSCTKETNTSSGTRSEEIKIDDQFLQDFGIKFSCIDNKKQ